MPDNARQLDRQNAALTAQLLEWIAASPRTYDEALETWRSSCPRHSIWEDSLESGFIEVLDGTLALTAAGRSWLHGDGAAAFRPG